MKMRMEPKYVKRRAIASFILGQATFLIYVVIFTYGIINNTIY